MALARVLGTLLISEVVRSGSFTLSLCGSVMPKVLACCSVYTPDCWSGICIPHGDVGMWLSFVCNPIPMHVRKCVIYFSWSMTGMELSTLPLMPRTTEPGGWY
ncbi:hypothetical protein F4777DRAFT_553200 [Nemania sp. FL0916]|nr:hypothetical protein F4777DRAFT_553200 [Nemania sp. FL0916]